MRRTAIAILILALFALWAQQSRTEEWPTYGGDSAETHYSPLNQINAGNVKQLGLAWSWETESPAGYTDRGDQGRQGQAVN